MEAEKSNHKVYGLQATRFAPRLRWSRSAPIAAVLLAFFVVPSFGDAWVMPRDGYYFKLSGSWVRTEEEFNYLGDRQEIFAEDQARSDALFRDMSISGYLEYGLTDHVTLVTSTQFKLVRTWEKLTPIVGVRPKQAIRTNYGMSDWWTRLRIPILRRPLAISLQTGLKLPLGYDADPENEGPPIGTGELDGDVALYAGYSFWPVPIYVDGGIGYRVRGGDFHDEVFYSAEVGYSDRRFFGKVRFDGISNTVDPPDIAGFTVVFPSPGGILNQVIVGDKDVYQISGELNFGIYKNLSFSAELFHIFAGKDTITGTSVVGGFVLSRK